MMANAQVFKKKLEAEKQPIGEGDRIVKESSRSPYGWGIAVTTAVATLVGLWLSTTYGVYAATNTDSWTTPTIVTGMSVLAMVLIPLTLVLLQSRSEREKKRRASILYVSKGFEEMVRETLRTSLRESMVEDFSVASADGTISRFDAVIGVGGQRLPVEIVYGRPNSDQILRMIESMKAAGFKRGLLVTSSQSAKPVKGRIRAKGIELFEAVASGEDLLRRLKTLERTLSQSSSAL